MKKLTDPITFGLAGLLLLFGALNYWKCQEAQAGGLQPPVPMHGDGVVHSMGVGPGGISTDGGISGYVTATGTTTPRQLADRATDKGVSILDFGDGGTCDGTTNHDASAAFQAAEAYLADAGGGTMLIPNSKCYVTQTLRISHNYITVRGLGPKSELAQGQRSPLLVISGAEAAVPYASPLTGNIDPTNCNAINMAAGDAIIVNDEANFGTLNGLTQLEVNVRYKPSAQTSGQPFVGSYGGLSFHNGGGLNSYGAFYLGNDDGHLTAKVTTTNGLCSAADTGIATLGTTAFGEMNFSGSRLYLHKDGVLVADVACTGSIVQNPWESVIVGGRYTEAWEEQLTNNPAQATLQGVRIRDQYVHGDGGYTVGNDPFTDSHSRVFLGLCNSLYSPGVSDVLVNAWFLGSPGLLPYYRTATYPASVSNVEIANLRISNTQGSMGILALGCQNCFFHDLTSIGIGRDILSLRNNSYDSRIYNMVFAGNGVPSKELRPGIRLAGASGLISVRDVLLNGKAFGLVSTDSGGRWDNIYAVSQYVNFWASGAGKVNANFLSGSYEGVTTAPYANLIMESYGANISNSLSVTGSTFENSSNSTAPVMIFDDNDSSRGWPMHIDTSSLLLTDGGAPTFVQFFGDWDAGYALFTNTTRQAADAGIPLCAGTQLDGGSPFGVCVDDRLGVRTFTP